MESNRLASSNWSRSPRFADYFVVCGLDLSSGLEPDNFSADNLNCTPLERSYKCKVLGHYPENVPWNPFDKNAVCMLCLPDGLQFRTQKHSLEPKFHSFVITKEDGCRTYGASFVFYEEMRKRKICSAVQTLQAMHLAEVSTGGRCKRPSVDHGNNTRSLPRHFKLSGHTRVAAQNYYDHIKDTLYVTKSIALICQQPYVHAAHIFLNGLYRCWKDQGSPSLESTVYSLLYEVTLPPPGRSMSFTCYPKEQVLIQRPTLVDELPFFDFPLRELFTLLGVDCVIQLFTCILLENQILLCSSEYQRLMLVAESLTALLLPFSWPHVYVPILPASCRHFLDAPVPFLMGLHTREPRLKNPSEGNLCFVDLDSRAIQMPEELPTFPHKSEFISEICDVLKRYKVPGEYLDLNLNNSGDNLMTSSCLITSNRQRKHSWADDLDDEPSLTQGSEMLKRIVLLAKRAGSSLDGLDDIGCDWDSFTDDGFSEEMDTSNEGEYSRDLKINTAVREIFLNRFVQMFSAYEHFVILPNQDKEEWLCNRESMQNFDKATFLSDQPQQQLPFLSRFIETQMFATLVDNKILSAWQPTDPNLRVFEKRIRHLRERYGENVARNPGYEPCRIVGDSLQLLDKRLACVDTQLPAPRELLTSYAGRTTSAGFPLLDSVLLNQEPSLRYRKRSSRLTHSHSSASLDDLDTLDTIPQQSMTGSMGRCRTAGGSEAFPLGGVGDRLATLPNKTEASPALIAQTNWNFVEKLLKDCKQKTKRMLVEKLGTEALEMGHSAQTSLVEENTLLASLCDLLERVWSHGLQSKQGKSSLWSHLLNYLELEESSDSSKPVDPNSLTPVVVSEEVLPAKLGFQEKILSSIKSSNIMEIASLITNNFDDFPFGEDLTFSV